MLLSRSIVPIMVTLLVGIHIVPFIGEIGNQSISFFECPVSENGYVLDGRNSGRSALEFSSGRYSREVREIVLVSAENHDRLEDDKFPRMCCIDGTDLTILAIAEPSGYGPRTILPLISLQTIENNVGVYALPSFNRCQSQ